MLSNTECNPKRIIQIVSGSRSGSSLLKYMLSKSPDVTSLDGEEETYYKYSGNGYGLTSDSDKFNTMVNPSLFRRCIQTELTTSSPWEWRLRLQYSGTALASLLERLPELDEGNPIPWLKERGIWGHYDGASREERIPFTSMAYEMAPYVIPTVRSTFVMERPEVLLLKAPYSVYRKGVLESIFPDAEFSYIILTRNPASTINGLIDGWNANYGFHKHLTSYGWWKFDLPPNWQTYVNKTIPERCWLQWQSSYTHAQEFQGTVIKFEDIMQDTQAMLHKLCYDLDIQAPIVRQLPTVMATEAPVPYRWKKRADVLLPLIERSEYLTHHYGYMDQSKWI